MAVIPQYFNQDAGFYGDFGRLIQMGTSRMRGEARRVEVNFQAVAFGNERFHAEIFEICITNAGYLSWIRGKRLAEHDADSIPCWFMILESFVDAVPFYQMCVWMGSDEAEVMGYNPFNV